MTMLSERQVIDSKAMIEAAQLIVSKTALNLENIQNELTDALTPSQLNEVHCLAGQLWAANIVLQQAYDILKAQKDGNEPA